MAIHTISRKRKTRTVSSAATHTIYQRSAPRSPEQEAYDRYSQDVSRHQRHPVTVNRAMALTNQPSPFIGSCNFFDRCTDEIMSLHYRSTLGLLDWMGFNVTDEYTRTMEFIVYTRPEMADGQPTSGALADPCEEPNGIEYGTAKLTVEDFGRYGRKGPVREIMKPTRYCATDPVRRLDGTVVTDEREWDMRFAMDVLLQDIQRDLITGNSANPGEMGGLEEWVRTNYPGPNGKFIRSTVVNWNGNPMTGGAGITVNGQAIGSYSFLDVLKSLLRRIKQRIGWARQLANQPILLGDMILVMPTAWTECLLDLFTCWSVCEGGEYTSLNLEQMEARNFRDNLVSATNPANLFGAGYIKLDGMTIPLYPYDWGLVKGPTTADIYLLTGSIGNVRIWEGEHLSATEAAAIIEDDIPAYFSTDGGRVLGLIEAENLCNTLKLWMMPRLWNRAPWAQIRFQNVRCTTPGGILLPDPLESSFFPLGSSFDPAAC